MNKYNLRILWGGLLIVVGGLFLLQEINLISGAWDIIWALLFSTAGALFLFTYWRDRSQWWPLIPGSGLLGLGALIIIDEYLPGAEWAAAVFLGAIGVSFWLIYFLQRENWWAVIPGGVLLTLTFVVALEPYVQGDADGGIFLLGLGLTFLILGLLPNSFGRMRWSFIPAAVLSIIGILLLGSNVEIFNYIWPLGLILLGGFFLIRYLRST